MQIYKPPTNSHNKKITKVFATSSNIRLPQYIKIEEIIRETPSINTFLLKSPVIARDAKPGQFVMVYVSQHLEEPEEVPMSLSYIQPQERTIGITVAKIFGGTTEAMHRHSVGNIFGIRGPYGHGFEITGKSVAIIGGGVGVAPLVPVIKKLKKDKRNVEVFIGAQTKNELLFVQRIKNLGISVNVTTDDGSSGEKGYVVDVFQETIAQRNYDHIMVSGPELMIKKILKIADKHKIPMQASLERYIKCGRGVCGQCAIDSFRVCTDGPVFSSDILRKLQDFGKYAMDVSGKVRPISEVLKTRIK